MYKLSLFTLLVLLKKQAPYNAWFCETLINHPLIMRIILDDDEMVTYLEKCVFTIKSHVPAHFLPKKYKKPETFLLATTTRTPPNSSRTPPLNPRCKSNFLRPAPGAILPKTLTFCTGRNIPTTHQLSD